MQKEALMTPGRYGDGEEANNRGRRRRVPLLVVIAPVALMAILIGMLVDALCRKDPV
jgi:hypothetical protein